jgi:hypothetical protein
MSTFKDQEECVRPIEIAENQSRDHTRAHDRILFEKALHRAEGYQTCTLTA